MSKEILLTHTICDKTELNGEQNLSKISSESEQETVLLGSDAGTSVTTNMSIYYERELQSQLSQSEQSDYNHDVVAENCYVFWQEKVGSKWKEKEQILSKI
jgi:hypothetical protein